MVKYIIKRLLMCFLMLFGVSVLIYLLIRMMPSDYIDIKMAAQILNGTVTAEDVENMRRLYGLHVELPIDVTGNLITISGWENFFSVFRSYINGYWNWLFSLIGGDLGRSFIFALPVATVINEGMWISFTLSGIALILQFAIGIPLGIYVSTRQYSAADNIATVIVLVGMALPSFFFANLLLLVFSQTLGWFPLQGLLSPGRIHEGFWDRLFDHARHLVLPITTVVVISTGGMMRFIRINMLEVLSADYIRTARAKGLSEKAVIYKHAFRNTLIPFATMLAGILPGLFSGLIILETVFNIPGIGNRAMQALTQGDIPFIMGFNIFLAVLTVIGMLLSDLTYMVVDPRVKLNK